MSPGLGKEILHPREICALIGIHRVLFPAGRIWIIPAVLPPPVLDVAIGEGEIGAAIVMLGGIVAPGINGSGLRCVLMHVNGEYTSLFDWASVGKRHYSSWRGIN